MFKKKPDIPPRPTLPTAEQIIEDIQGSSSDDVVFNTETDGTNSPALGSNSESGSPELTYQRVKIFADLNTSLKKRLYELHDQSEALKVSDMELKVMADDIRKQALEAIQ